MNTTTENAAPVSPVETAKALGLLEEEYKRIVEILGREPNFNELSIFAVMWSEHCSYKNSIKWLKTLPREGEALLAAAGEENAGLVDIGDGLACCFKIESHNHPSAIEPYQGAATGVGGINRDIFTMGARPIAQLNSLRFGHPRHRNTRHLIKGVVKGIGDYGNAFGIPTVGGEVFFDESYNINPLVNAMSAGIARVGETVSAISYGPGNPVFIVGSATGKDGIHGATFASGDLDEDSHEDLPAVQVGDPFQEKLLLEATMEVIRTGAVVGMQDMGAAGIICSNSEMSAKGKAGMVIHLDKVPTRQENMQPWEILLSESQERMLIVGKKGREQEILDVFAKWDLRCAQIGEVTKEETLKYYMNGELVAQVPPHDLVLGGGAPVYEREYREPAYYAEYKKFDASTIEIPGHLREVALHLAGNLNVASKRWVYNQYDSMVGTVNMSTNLPSDAAIVDVRGTQKALALTVDCNSRFVNADPYQGAAMAVAEAARNIVCSGGKPSAITNCLNFGNPYVPEVYWQFVQAVQGMGAACKKLGTPVTGGNVSFYNQSTDEGPVFPTPTIGMLGILEDKKRQTGLAFRDEGDVIVLLGAESDHIECSEYLASWHQVRKSPVPPFDLEAEARLQDLLYEMISTGYVRSAHDASDGGLFFALLESAMAGNKGFEITGNPTGRPDGYWFGEAPSRVVLSMQVQHVADLELMAFGSKVPFKILGRVQATPQIKMNGEEWGTLQDFSKPYQNAFHEWMDEDPA